MYGMLYSPANNKLSNDVWKIAAPLLQRKIQEFYFRAALQFKNSDIQFIKACGRKHNATLLIFL